MNPVYDQQFMNSFMQQQQPFNPALASLGNYGMPGMQPGFPPMHGGGGGGGRGGRGGGRVHMNNHHHHHNSNSNSHHNPHHHHHGGSNHNNGPNSSATNAPPNAPQRNNEIGDVSPVVHLRNVTPDVSQLSIQNLAQSFGRIRHLVMLRQKNQALVEMDSPQAAQQMVDFFKDPGFAEIDGRRVYVRYSTHQELTATQQTSKTLLVSMFNTHYDVSAAAQITPSIVFQIFGTYGAVEKIVVLPKNDSSSQNHNRVQALVQFESKEIADNVKSVLQGQPVTLGETVTFTLDIQFSKMDEIKASSPHNSLVINKNGTPTPGAPQGGPSSAGGSSNAPVGSGQPFLPSQSDFLLQQGSHNPMWN